MDRVDDKDDVVEDRGAVYESSLVEADNLLSCTVDVANSVVDAVEYAMINVTGVGFDTTHVEAVKYSHSAEDENASDVTMDVLNGAVDVVNDGKVNLHVLEK
ncbi:hypothetical protein K2173_010965 [Erythroxylum novogranatense]|uniref:Uncharacterized protein n=1 Tax=Erythroxylum novogranatense TaxID=1862640 RepID=A0AAV8T1X1_9ROSI|nr:hypothetical protein K2173_010965 [Erythroxylum novogranatense]